MSQIFKEFTGKPTHAELKSAYGTGDVKYHLGTSYDRPTANGGHALTAGHNAIRTGWGGPRLNAGVTS